jgi:hypothetical protein
MADDHIENLCLELENIQESHGISSPEYQKMLNFLGYSADFVSVLLDVK